MILIHLFFPVSDIACRQVLSDKPDDFPAPPEDSVLGQLLLQLEDSPEEADA